MKNILKMFVLLAFIYSCEDNADYDTDRNTGTSTSEGSSVVDVSVSSLGKLLGVPSSQDFETATVALAENVLDLEIILRSGGLNVASYEITKSINGGENVTVVSSPTLPISLNYSTAEEFVDGLGIGLDDLRIGDVVTFRTKMVKNDGTETFAGPNNGSYSITVSCSSDLAGEYNLQMVASNGWNINFPNETIIEKSPGLYKTEGIYRWGYGSIAPDQGFDFLDVCGELSVLDQGLAQGYYSNEVFQTEPGNVDGVTGNLQLFYTVNFSSGDVTCVGTYVKL
jgi:hypothetical protein